MSKVLKISWTDLFGTHSLYQDADEIYLDSYNSTIWKPEYYRAYLAAKQSMETNAEFKEFVETIKTPNGVQYFSWELLELETSCILCESNKLFFAPPGVDFKLHAGTIRKGYMYLENKCIDTRKIMIDAAVLSKITTLGLRIYPKNWLKTVFLGEVEILVAANSSARVVQKAIKDGFNIKKCINSHNKESFLLLTEPLLGLEEVEF
jgi:hypothetical protein